MGQSRKAGVRRLTFDDRQKTDELIDAVFGGTAEAGGDAAVDAGACGGGVEADVDGGAETETAAACGGGGHRGAGGGAGSGGGTPVAPADGVLAGAVALGGEAAVAAVATLAAGLQGRSRSGYAAVAIVGH